MARAGGARGGRLKLSRALSSYSDCPVKGSIEYNEQQVKFEQRMARELIVHRDFYAQTWAEDELDADWVGGGPPCVWSSKAGAQREDDERSQMFTHGTAEVADHCDADFADWEQPYEAALLREGKAIGDIGASNSQCRKPMRRTPLVE